jgi:TonB family protein
MSGGLGPPLALSILAHAGAATALAALGAAWLAGSPAVPPAPPALYVDLLHPIVAMSDGHEARDGAPHLKGATAPPRLPESAPRASVRATMPAPPGATAAVADTPIAEPATLTRTEPEMPRPPVVPGSPTHRDVSMPPPTVTTETHASPPGAFSPLAGDFARGARATALSSGAVDDRASGPSSVDGGPSSRSPGAEPRPDSGGTAHGIGAASPGGTSSSAGGSAPNTPDTVNEGTALARLSPAGQGSGGAPDSGVPPEYESYVRALRQRIQERLVYPWAAVRRAQQGVVELELRVGADGRLIAVEVVAGASADALRTAAVTAVRGSAPFPFPAGLVGRALVIRLPVEFRLR